MAVPVSRHDPDAAQPRICRKGRRLRPSDRAQPLVWLPVAQSARSTPYRSLFMTKARAIPVSLHEPGEPPSSGPQLKAFLELGFRPLYIAGCAWALLSVALWVYAPQWLSAPLGGVAWHAHEMLWGFVATIAVGFLLTASATWTGINPLQGL